MAHRKRQKGLTMTKLIKIENGNSISWMQIAGRKVRFISAGGSSYDMTRAAIQKRVSELSAKESLSASSKETLATMRKAEEFATANGL